MYFHLRKPLSSDRGDRCDNEVKSSISVIIVAAIAGKVFPYDRSGLSAAGMIHTYIHTYSPLPRYGDLVSTPRSGDPGLQGIFSNNMHGV